MKHFDDEVTVVSVTKGICPERVVHSNDRDVLLTEGLVELTALYTPIVGQNIGLNEQVVN